MSLTLNKMAEWIAAHKKAVVTVLKVIGIVAAAGAGLLALGLVFKTTAFAVGTLCTAFTILKAVALAPIAAVKGLIAVFGFLKTAMISVKIASIAMWTAITSPAFLIGAALTGIVAIVWKLSGAWDMCAKQFSGIAGDFSNAFSEIGRIFGETWNTIKTALSSGDLSGAAKVAMKALKSVWLTGIAPLKKAWYELENFLSDSWTVIVYSLIKTGNDLWYGLLAGLKQIGNAIQDSWDFIWNGVVAAFEKTLLELQKAWIRTKGFFDSEEEVNAEINVVEQEYNDRKQAREKASSDSKSQRESELKTIQDDWKRDNESVDTLMNSETDTHRQEYN